MMEHDEDKRTRRLLRFAFGLAAFASAGGALAQVTPVEPFGGRPFGSDRAAPAPQQGAAQQPMVVQPGTAPVVVQPGGAPVVVQPPQGQPQQAVQAPPPAPPPPPPPPPQAQPQPQQQQGMAGPSGRPSSSVNPQSSNGTTATARQERQQDGDMAVPPIVNAPPAPVTPPFTANRAPALGTAGAAGASAAQQPVRGLPADAPRLVISGSVYSPDAGRRMLIVNGQVFREGADLGSGVMLQEVRPDSAVLGFKGGRYNVFF